MEVLHRQDLLHAGLHPPALPTALARRAVAVAARVVGWALVAAPAAAVEVSAKRSCPAGLRGAQGLELLCRQRAARDDRGTVLTEDVRDTEPRPPGRACPRHAVVGVVLAYGVDAGYGPFCTNRSSGLCTLLTWLDCTAM